MKFIGLLALIWFLFFILYLFISMWIDMRRYTTQITVGSKWEIWEGDPFKEYNVVEIVDERGEYVKYLKQTFNSDGTCVGSESNSMSKQCFVRELLKTRFKQIQ